MPSPRPVFVQPSGFLCSSGFLCKAGNRLKLFVPDIDSQALLRNVDFKQFALVVSHGPLPMIDVRKF
jgi:hypothetical protein